jgi:nucleoside-diphosphate-sugar epimerase
MSILITGAGGYVGQELTAALLESTPLETRLVIADVSPLPPLLPSAQKHASRVKSVQLDLTSAPHVDELINDTNPYDAVYILHGIMSSGAEANFELGLQVNLDSIRYILDRLRTTMPGVKTVFTSSLAVYGVPPPGVLISEANFPPVPCTSYGSQKLMVELLVNDYSRRGFLDGRCVRLPTVTVRPGKPTQAASSFASGIVREPLNGEKAILPVSKDTDVWLCSPHTVVKNLVLAKDIPKEAFGSSRSVNLPGQKVSVHQILDALEEVGGKEKRDLVEEKHDEEIDRIVQTWATCYDTSRAAKLGFSNDVPFLETVKKYASQYAK